MRLLLPLGIRPVPFMLLNVQLFADAAVRCQRNERDPSAMIARHDDMVAAGIALNMAGRRIDREGAVQQFQLACRRIDGISGRLPVLPPSPFVPSTIEYNRRPSASRFTKVGFRRPDTSSVNVSDSFCSSNSYT